MNLKNPGPVSGKYGWKHWHLPTAQSPFKMAEPTTGTAKHRAGHWGRSRLPIATVTPQGLAHPVEHHPLDLGT